MPPNGQNTAHEYNELESVHHHESLVMLHIFATLMYLPSFGAWYQRTGMGLPMLWDLLICFGVIFHGGCGIRPFPIVQIQGQQVGLSGIYLVSGFFCYWFSLASALYRALYPMAIVGVFSTAWRIYKWYREWGEAGNREHQHVD